MRKNGLKDVLKVLAYVVVSFLLAAAISPLLFKAGKSFASIFANRDTTDGLVWLAKKAASAEFDTYFKRSLLLAAVIGLFPLIHSLKSSQDPNQPGYWSTMFRRPRSAISSGPLTGPRQFGMGILITSSTFLAMALVVQILGWRYWSAPWEDLPGTMLQCLQPAIFASLLEEIFFRGFLMAIFLRAFRPSIAILGLSLLFAAVHFLQPPSHTAVSNPYALTSGFEMLALIAQRFLEAKLFIFSFMALFLTGLILAMARYSTRSLWLPLGLHTGWIFSLKFYFKTTDRYSDFPADKQIYLGEKVIEGIFPLVTLVITSIIVGLYLRKIRVEDNPQP